MIWVDVIAAAGVLVLFGLDSWPMALAVLVLGRWLFGPGR